MRVASGRTEVVRWNATAIGMVKRMRINVVTLSGSGQVSRVLEGSGKKKKKMKMIDVEIAVRGRVWKMNTMMKAGTVADGGKFGM